MRTLLAAAALLAITAAADAQSLPAGTGIPLNQEREVSPEQRAKQKATEDAYRATMKGIPDAKPVDPWGNMRGTDQTSNAKAKPAAKKSGTN